MKLLLPNLKHKIWNCYSLISKKIKNEFKKENMKLLLPNIQENMSLKK